VSAVLGVCIVSHRDGVHIISAIDGRVMDLNSAPHNLSHADDWRVIEMDSVEDAIEHTKEVAVIERSRALIQMCLMADSDDQKDLLDLIEQSLIAGVSDEALSDRLLVAAFDDKHAQALKSTVERALAEGCGATAAVLARVHDLQPLLRRLISTWFSPTCAPTVEDDFRYYLWGEVFRNRSVVRLLEAGSASAVSSVLAELSFSSLTKQADRARLATFGRSLGEQLFPSSAKLDVAALARGDRQRSSIEAPPRQRGFTSGHQRYEQTLAQITAIANAVAEGREDTADKFLRELIARQEFEADTSRAIKSLCNLAKQCADMFRVDFERKCLDAAYERDPTDGWLLVQLGDHYKRIGDYHSAREVLGRVPDSDVAQSVLADVYAQQGQYQEAIALYKRTANWESSSICRTAIADCLRRKGELHAAALAYDEIDRDGLGTERTVAGRAQIARMSGDLSRSLKHYNDLFANFENKIDDRAMCVYRFSYASVLKQNGDWINALRIADQLIMDAPFMMNARVLRASILGLQNEAMNGLELVSTGTANAFGEWVRAFTRGLLLMRTQQFQQARTELRNNLERDVLACDERGMLRLAAAVAFLGTSEWTKAEHELNNVGNTHNAYSEYLRNVLEYHVAVVRSEQQKASELMRRLNEGRAQFPRLWKAVECIRSNHMADALRLEVDGLLMLAA
jgi:tetratricopeptide (TPR) repeat protein